MAILRATNQGGPCLCHPRKKKYHYQTISSRMLHKFKSSHFLEEPEGNCSFRGFVFYSTYCRCFIYYIIPFRVGFICLTKWNSNFQSVSPCSVSSTTFYCKWTVKDWSFKPWLNDKKNIIKIQNLFIYWQFHTKILSFSHTTYLDITLIITYKQTQSFVLECTSSEDLGLNLKSLQFYTLFQWAGPMQQENM